jgi:hypothetical protein
MIPSTQFGRWPSSPPQRPTRSGKRPSINSSQAGEPFIKDPKYHLIKALREDAVKKLCEDGEKDRNKDLYKGLFKASEAFLQSENNAKRAENLHWVHTALKNYFRISSLYPTMLH